MTDTTELEERLASAWHDGPPHAPVAARLVAGQRALRRQRVLTTAATTFVTVAVVGIGAAVLGGPGETRTIEPAPAPSTVAPAVDLGEFWAGYDDAGSLVVRDDVTVLQSVEDPLGTGTSVALDLRRDGVERWYLVTDDGNDPTVVVPEESQTPDTDAFLVWVQLQDPSGDPVAGADPAGVRTWVSFEDGRLTALVPEVRVDRLLADPDIPGFVEGTDASVAAALTVDGTRYYVLARHYADGGPPEYFRISAKQGGPTLETMLEFARAKYGSGEGMR